jgi:GT2 family glycosyltransferase
MKLKLSLVTGKVERDAPFQRLVDSIIRETSVPWELVVADASQTAYVPQDDRIRVLHEKPRLTHSRGYNAAFRACLGEWVIWLNDDAEVCPRYDTEAIAFMESHPRVGMGALHYSECGGPFHVNSSWDVIYPNFGIFRKDLGERVGYFDEDIHMYGADNSLAFRILLSDHGIADIPKARILHHSEKDAIREGNQARRKADNRVLTEKYMPQRRHWLFAYRRHHVPSGELPWVHGVRPQAVGAR